MWTPGRGRHACGCVVEAWTDRGRSVRTEGDPKEGTLQRGRGRSGPDFTVLNLGRPRLEDECPGTDPPRSPTGEQDGERNGVKTACPMRPPYFVTKKEGSTPPTTDWGNRRVFRLPGLGGVPVPVMDDLTPRVFLSEPGVTCEPLVTVSPLESTRRSWRVEVRMI